MNADFSQIVESQILFDKGFLFSFVLIGVYLRHSAA